MFTGDPQRGETFPLTREKVPSRPQRGETFPPSERKFPPGGKQEKRTQGVPDASHWPIIINMKLSTMHSVYSNDLRSLHYPLLTICGHSRVHAQNFTIQNFIKWYRYMWLIHYLSSELSYNRLAATSFINTISYHHYRETTHYNHLTVYYFVIQCMLTL